MDWIPPTLREDAGEVKAALRRELPDLGERRSRSAATCTPTPA